MAVILFSEDDENGWKKAGWVVRQILDDTLSQYPEDSAMASEFDLAKQRSWIVISSPENPEFAGRVINAIRHTAAGILSGDIRSGIHDRPYGDAKTVNQYCEALKELLQVIPAEPRS